MNHPCSRPLLVGIVLLTTLWACPRISAEPATAAAPRERVLFPFDDYSIPFNKGVLLTLVPGRKSSVTDPDHPNKPVVRVGKPGDPDERRVYFAGTVIKVGDEYRMWYSGYDREARRHLCYAVSKDGINWEKPPLGLVPYKGGTANNLVAIDGDKEIRGSLFLVLHDPEDPDPAKRFKLMWEMDPTNQVKAAFSPDGLRWTIAAEGKFLVTAEPSGLVKHEGLYYINGHSGAIRHPVAGAQKRTMQTFMSSDFVNWTPSAHMSFRRDNIPPRPILDFESHHGEQLHTGASIWNRGNVFLGFYGQWHNETNDRRTCIVDIGLVVSPDALHFKEPVPDFKLVPSFEETDRAEPRLTQGQAFENIGDRTLFWYGIWTEVDRDGPTGVRVATWPRDRLGNFRPAPGVADPQCLTSPQPIRAEGSRIFVNADGLSANNHLKVELLDEQLRPIPGYSGDDCVPVVKSGFRTPVTWKGGEVVRGNGQPVRIRISWGGDRPDCRLWAIYVE
jgi:hypothetical protein